MLSYYWVLIGSHICRVAWHKNGWPWVTLYGRFIICIAHYLCDSWASCFHLSVQAKVPWSFDKHRKLYERTLCVHYDPQSIVPTSSGSVRSVPWCLSVVLLLTSQRVNLPFYRIEIRQPNAKIRSCSVRLRRIIRLGENTFIYYYLYIIYNVNEFAF